MVEFFGKPKQYHAVLGCFSEMPGFPVHLLVVHKFSVQIFASGRSYGYVRVDAMNYFYGLALPIFRALYWPRKKNNRSLDLNNIRRRNYFIFVHGLLFFSTRATYSRSLQSIPTKPNSPAISS